MEPSRVAVDVLEYDTHHLTRCYPLWSTGAIIEVIQSFYNPQALALLEHDDEIIGALYIYKVTVSGRD